MAPDSNLRQGERVAPGCCFRGCTRTVTQAFDVWSWFKAIREQTPTHYEACDRHAYLFEGYTGRANDRRTFMVRERCTPTPLDEIEVAALRQRAVMRGLSHD